MNGLSKNDISHFLSMRDDINKRLEIMGECVAVICEYDAFDIETSVDDFSFTIHYMLDSKELSYTYSFRGDEKKLANYRKTLIKTKKNYDESQKLNEIMFGNEIIPGNAEKESEKS